MAWITFEIGGSVKEDVLFKVAETAKPAFSRDPTPMLGQLYFYAPRNFDAGAFPVHVKLDDDVKHFIVQGDMDIESAEEIERLLRRRKIDFNRWDDAFDEFNPRPRSTGVWPKTQRTGRRKPITRAWRRASKKRWKSFATP